MKRERVRLPRRLTEALEQVGVELGFSVEEQAEIAREARREIGEYEARRQYIEGLEGEGRDWLKPGRRYMRVTGESEYYPLKEKGEV